MQLIATKKLTASVNTTTPKINVGISACLLGHEVRYNGGHTRSKLCLNTLSEYFSYRSFCPEVAAGFGVPRPTLRLVGDVSAPRLVFSGDTQKDVTSVLNQAITPVIDSFTDLDGYILMKNSPSCGLARIKVYQDNGYPQTERTQGLFTRALQQRYPSLPVEEEGRLNDPHLRENFVLRVFAHHQFRQQVDGQLSLGALMNFHRDYKYVLMAHHPLEYRALGKLLAETGRQADLTQVRDLYHGRFMAALSTPASRKNHRNVLLHILGYLKRSVEGEARRDMVAVIDRYSRGEVNLATPLTLLDHYVQLFGSDYIRAQRYLKPYPQALGLTSRL
ncbi:MAG: hypothetical protein ACJAWL_000544 [Motiliproteus sp.]|jgi:uncharacterized protein YbgA (DUF1722 family)/uncharacterized protein YbbK (DUF523 family)